MALILASQQVIADAEKAVETRKANALNQFERVKHSLTNEELGDLADRCGAETGPDHCVYCAAWAELMERRNV